MSDDLVWQRRFERERTARREAELLLHDKSRELYLANNAMSERAADLAASLAQLHATQAHLVEREKLAALGGLVAGVAHEINTPIGVAVTAVSHASDRTRALADAARTGPLTRGELRQVTEEVGEALRLALDSLQRAAALVQSFKNVAVDQVSGDVRDVMLDDLAQDVISSLAAVLRRARVEGGVEARERVRASVDAGALTQILTNLVQNACAHAFVGPVTEGPSRTLRIVVEDDARGVDFRVEDNGRGMEPDVAARVYEPFFTTARGSGGTGLGMHIVHNLVTGRFGGTVTLDTKPGTGTRWHVVLPYGTPALSRKEPR